MGKITVDTLFAVIFYYIIEEADYCNKVEKHYCSKRVL